VHKPTGAFALHATDDRMLRGYNGPYLKCTANLTCQPLYCQLFASCLAVFVIAKVTSIHLNNVADLRLTNAVGDHMGCMQAELLLDNAESSQGKHLIAVYHV